MKTSIHLTTLVGSMSWLEFANQSAIDRLDHLLCRKDQRGIIILSNILLKVK